MELKTFQGRYLGKCMVTDNMDKKTIKMATRRVTKYHKELSLDSTIKIHIEMKSTSILVTMYFGPDCKDVINISYDRISCYYILKEDKRIISLVVTNEQLVSEVHVFRFISYNLAEQMANILLNAFQNNPPKMIEFDEVDQNPVVEDIVDKVALINL